MGLSIIYGRTGSGKTAYLFQKVKEESKKVAKVYVVTPEQFSFTAEKELLETSGTCATIKSEVLTFSRMAYRVINDNGNNLENIEGFGKSMLIYDILDKEKGKLKFLGNNLQNANILDRTMSELKKHNISKEKLKEVIDKTEDKYLKAKLSDILCIYSKFEERIDKEFLDDNDALSYLADNIENTCMFDNSVVFIDEFSGFTPQEYRVIEELLKVCKDVYITVCTDDLGLECEYGDSDVFYSNKVTANKLIKIAQNNNINISKPVHLSENHRFKSKELKHLEENIYSNIYKKYDTENKDIKLFLAMNPYSEIENVANKIIENVRDKGYRYKEIGIITKDIDTYSGLIKAIFSKYDIPVYIDEKKDISQNILIKYITSLLDIFAKNWSYESVISYVKLKLCADLEDNDIYLLEDYCKKWGIKYSKWYREDWKFGADEESLIKLNEIRRKVILPLLKFKEKCYKDMSAFDLSKNIYQFLIENNIDKKLQEKAEILGKTNADLASEYEASFNMVINILDEIVKVFKNQSLSFDKYASLLKISFKENELGKLPAGFDQITVRRCR